MALKVGELYSNLSLDTSKFDGALSKAEKDFRKAGESISKLGKGLTAAVTLPLVGIGAGMIKAASDAEEMRGKFSVVFADLEDDVRAWAQETSNAVGRSQIALEGYLSETQNMLVGMGMARDAGADLSKEIVQLGIDLASFNNLAEDHALGNLQSAISGNHEASKSLGAVLNENTLAMAMERMQIRGKFRDLDETTKMQVRYNAILMQSEDAIGDAERTSGSFANQMRRLRGNISDLAVEMGDVLLPHATFLAEVTNELVEQFKGLSDEAKTNIVIMGAVAAAIGPILLVMGTLMKTVAAVGVKTSLLVAGLGLLAGAFVSAYTNSEEFRNMVNNSVSGVVDFFSTNIPKIVDFTLSTFESARDIAGNLITSMGQLIMSIWKTIQKGWLGESDTLLGSLLNRERVIFEIVKEVMVDMYQFLIDIYSGILEFWMEYGDRITEAAKIAWGLVFDIITGILKAVVDATTWLWENVLAGIIFSTWELIKAMCQSALETILALVVIITGIILGDWETFTEGLEMIWDAAWTALKGIMEFGLGILKILFVNFFGVSEESWQSFTDVIIGIWETLWNLAKETFMASMDIIKGIADVFIGIFTLDWEKFSSGIQGIWDGMWRNIYTIASTAWELLSVAFGILYRSIKDWFLGLVTDAYDWGKNMIQGFIDGITSMIGSVKSAVGSVMSAAKGLIGFNSPAEEGEGRYIENWGANMIDGFLDGVRSMIPDVKMSMGEMVANMRPNVQMPAMAGSTAGTASISISIHVDGRGQSDQQLANMIRSTLSHELNRRVRA